MFHYSRTFLFLFHLSYLIYWFVWFQEFSKDQLSDFLAKIVEAAEALFDKMKDPWGFNLEA